MNRCLALILLLALAPTTAITEEPKKQTEQELLAELQKLAATPEKKDLRGLDAEEVREFMITRARSALKAVSEFQDRFPNSPALPEARSAALQSVGGVDDEDVRAAAMKVARALRESATKGSDRAAEADLFMAGQDFRQAMQGAKSLDDFNAVWSKHADAIRKEAEGYMATYPKYRPGADAVASLARMAEIAHDDKTAQALIELVEKYQPDHPLARARVRQKAVGKEFDFTYTPLGSDTPARLNDLRGKVVVVYFWAVWCVPCKAETKRMTELYEKYHKDGLEIIAVSQDEKEELVPKFVKVKKIEWPQWVGAAARQFAVDWGVDSLPTEFVIDRKGRLHNANASGKLEEIVPRLLQEKE
jgi:thiol-disulfide isomerase/thioredoxin